MKVGQGKKWTFFSIGCCGSVFESLSAAQSEDALVTDVTSSDDVLVESDTGESSVVYDQTSFAEDET